MKVKMAGILALLAVLFLACDDDIAEVVTLPAFDAPGSVTFYGFHDHDNTYRFSWKSVALAIDYNGYIQANGSNQIAFIGNLANNLNNSAQYTLDKAIFDTLWMVSPDEHQYRFGVAAVSTKEVVSEITWSDWFERKELGHYPRSAPSRVVFNHPLSYNVSTWGNYDIQWTSVPGAMSYNGYIQTDFSNQIVNLGNLTVTYTQLEFGLLHSTHSKATFDDLWIVYLNGRYRTPNTDDAKYRVGVSAVTANGVSERTWSDWFEIEKSEYSVDPNARYYSHISSVSFRDSEEDIGAFIKPENTYAFYWISVFLAIGYNGYIQVNGSYEIALLGNLTIYRERYNSSVPAFISYYLNKAAFEALWVVQKSDRFHADKYRFGVSAVTMNGSASEITWSDWFERVVED